MPTYNSENYILESIQSIINQSHENWELLITDDCSTDNTIELIKEYIKKDKRIKLFKLKKNSGAGIARNFSLKNATGRYIAFCDSDDKWKKNKLELQLKFMQENDLVFSFSDYEVIDEDENYKGYVKCPTKLTYKKLLKNNYIGCLTAIYDAEFLGKLMMPKIRKRQDWVLWLIIMRKIESTKGLSTSLAFYKDRSNSISSSKFNLLKYNWIVYRQELGFNKITSFCYLIIFIIHYFFKKYL